MLSSQGGIHHSFKIGTFSKLWYSFENVPILELHPQGYPRGCQVKEAKKQGSDMRLMRGLFTASAAPRFTLNAGV